MACSSACWTDVELLDASVLALADADALALEVVLELALVPALSHPVSAMAHITANTNASRMDFFVMAIVSSSYFLSATSRAVAALFSYRREYGIKGVHGAEGACCVVQEFGSSRKAGASDPQVDVN